MLEGIMMKNGKDYAVAVRKPDKEIEVKKDEYRSFIKWEKLTKIPFIRGIFNFVDSMVLGMKTLTYSASFYEEEETSRVLTEEEAKKQEKKDAKENPVSGHNQSDFNFSGSFLPLCPACGNHTGQHFYGSLLVRSPHVFHGKRSPAFYQAPEPVKTHPQNPSYLHSARTLETDLPLFHRRPVPGTSG